MNNNIEFVSLFSGCGGLDLGFIMAGFHCVGAFDKDKKVIQVHKKNISCKKLENVDLSLEKTFTELGLVPKWEARGAEKMAVKIAQKMLRKGFTVEQTAELSGLDITKIRGLSDTL